MLKEVLVMAYSELIKVAKGVSEYHQPEVKDFIVTSAEMIEILQAKQ